MLYFVGVFLNFEVSQFFLNSGSSNSPLGFESGNIEDNQISASSFDTSVNYFFPPWQARLNNNATLVVGFQHSYWQTLANYWIQVSV